MSEEKTDRTLEAIRGSLKHWFDVRDKYEQIRGGKWKEHIWGDKCALCKELHCADCPLNDSGIYAFCCKEWRACSETWGTDDFPAKADLMIERLWTERDKLLACKLGNEVEALAGHYSFGSKRSTRNGQRGKIIERRNDTGYDWQVEFYRDGVVYGFSDHELKVIKKEKKDMSEKMHEIEALGGRKVSDSTIAEAVKEHCGIEEEKPYQFQAGDVVINTVQRKTRLIVKYKEKLLSFDTQGHFVSEGQDAFVTCKYKCNGKKISDYIK